MKLVCQSCGAHFPKEFKDTLKRDCQFWEQHTADYLPEEAKKKIWDWIFKLNSDEFALKYSVLVRFDFSVTPINPKDEFVNIVPNWEKMTEKEQQEFQKDHFKDLMKVQAYPQKPRKVARS